MTTINGSNPNNDNVNTPSSDLSENELLQIKSSQTLVTIATIAGPVSLIFGGVLLSVIAIICASIALSKVNRIYKPNAPEIIVKVRKTTIAVFVICGVALALNAISLYLIIPAVVEMIQTGDISALNSYIYDVLPGNSNVSSGDTDYISIWDL